MRTAEDLAQVDDVGELDVSEYLVLLLAWDTYFRYLKEATGSNEPSDTILQQGVTMLRAAEMRSGDGFQSFLDSNLPTPVHKKMLVKAWRFALTRDGLPRKALQLRTLLSRGGASTMRNVFKTNKALQQVRAAMAAAMIEDADAALDKFAVIQTKNTRIRTWISRAADYAGSGTFQNPVSVGSKQGVDDTTNLLAARVEQAAASPTSQVATEAEDFQEDLLAKVQTEAQEAAQKALSVIGEKDEPPAKSEVIGIAAAAVAAAMSDPTNLQNVPASLRSHANDPEQLAAAMAMGRVLVQAGAGSGKTATLTSRIAYLVNDLKVSPNRIFACSFNRKASIEIRERIASKTGEEAVSQMSVGTMHSMFKKFVVDYGTPEEKATLTTWLMPTGGKKGGGMPSRAPTPGAMAGYMSRVWKECFDEDPPRKAGTAIQLWMMNDISPQQAQAEAKNEEEKQKAIWYEWFLGFKGVNKNWAPPCLTKSKRANTQWGEFLAKWRDNGRARLGDFSDMILMFRNMLARDPNVRKKIQGMFDHIAADEAQDLNKVQFDIMEFMSEHVAPDGSDKRSWFMVGDINQAINGFAGARPELFAAFAKRPDFQVKKISTNYRCLPEIIETANNLLAGVPKLLDSDSKADSTKPRGAASIVLQSPGSHADGAIQTIEQIKQNTDAGDNLSDYAVLTRTNMEINDYETACIIAGVPYGRKGGTSFLRSPETVTVMCYANLVVGQDFERMTKSLIEVLDKPRRFFLRAGEAETVVMTAIRALARRNGVSEKAVNPLELFDSPSYLLDALDPQRRWPNWRVQKAEEQIRNMGYALRGMRESVEKGKYDRNTGETKPYTTQDMLGDILGVTGVAEKFGEPEPTLRDVLMPGASVQEEEGDAPQDDDEAAKKPIGNVQFLFQIAQPNADSPDGDPSDPRQFKARIDNLAAKSKDLRVDLDAWYYEQQKLAPEKRTSAPCVVLSTVHSTKGAQWANTTVVMAKGVFPFEPKKKPGEELLSPEQLESQAKEREEQLRSERQLAYVAMTRAAKSLTIVCPQVNAYGREAGTSPFVNEAGIRPGQNVEGKNDPTPDPVESPVKTAGYDDWYPVEEPPASYDRGVL